MEYILEGRNMMPHLVDKSKLIITNILISKMTFFLELLKWSLSSRSQIKRK